MDLESRSGFGLWASVIVDEAVHQRAKEKSKFAELQMETMKSSKEPLRYRRYGRWEHWSVSHSKSEEKIKASGMRKERKGKERKGERRNEIYQTPTKGMGARFLAAYLAGSR